MELLPQIECYQPVDTEEQKIKQVFLQRIQTTPETILTRTNQEAHLTASGFILNPELDKALLVHHNIYNALSWTGGHADGDADLLAVAVREAQEETGLQNVYPLSQEILSLDLLPVPEHKKRGETVAAHQHLSAAYGLIATEDQPLAVNPAENTQVVWVPLAELDQRCTEKNMLPLYHKLIARMQQKAAAKQELLAAMAEPLLAWYGKHARVLPWRDQPTPYRVWVSEIMLQQTRVEAVKPYYDRFLAALPDVQALAQAPEEQLLKLWEGLGYYNRVRNMQKAARAVVVEHQGQFPADFNALLALPGIGDYTAGAVASIAFGLPEPAVDGNVLRVVARIAEDFRDITKVKTKRDLTGRLRRVYPASRCGDFTQSLMELGATICLPNGAPLCGSCPVAGICLAYQHDTVADLPVKTAKKPRKKQQKTVLLLTCGNQVAICKRPPTGLLASLWQFPNLEGHLSQQQLQNWCAGQGIIPDSIVKSLRATHIFTHVEWEMQSYCISCSQSFGLPGWVWLTKAQLAAQYSLPSAFKPFLQAL